MDLRKCIKCDLQKEITLFRRRKKWFSHTCKECYAKQYRTGKPNLGRFKKGHISTHGFKKGQPSKKKGIPLSEETKSKLSAALMGRKRSPEIIEKARLALLASPNKFRDGKSRRSRKSVQWSLTVKERDGGKCMHCLTAENLHAHHIIPWKKDENLRYELSNGITLCKSCHKKEELRCFPHAPRPKGTKFTEEHRKKLSEARKGKIPWNKKISLKEI